MVPTLSDSQQETVWNAWLGAEVRAAYFAALVNKFQLWQKVLVVSGLLLSSGATITLLTTLLPPQLNWIRPALTVLAAGMSLWSLVAKNERNAIDSADLHFRWNTLADQYEALWSNMYSEEAADRLAELKKEEALISKSSTVMPNKKALLERVQQNAMMHHQSPSAA